MDISSYLLVLSVVKKKIQPWYRIWFIFFIFFVSNPVFWPYLAIFGVPWPTLDFFLAPYEMGCIVLCFGYWLGPKSTIIYLFWDFWRVFPWKTSFLSFLAISVMFEAPVLCLGKTDSAKLLMDGLHMYQWPSRPTIGVKCPLSWNLGHSTRRCLIRPRLCLIMRTIRSSIPFS